MENVIIISLISSLGLGLSIFFGIIFLKNGKTPSRFLGLILIILALRIAKSVFYNFIELPLMVKNLGLAANLAVGPLLYFYGLSLVNSKMQLNKNYLIHFTPSIIYIVFGNVIPNGVSNPSWYYSYSFILLQSFFYIAISLYSYYTHMNNLETKIKKWYLQLILVLASVWIVYTLIFIGLLPIYAAGPVAYSLLIFFLSFLSINKHKKVFALNKLQKYSNSTLSFEQGKNYFEKLESIVKKEKLYLQPNITLTSLAEEIDLSSKEISQIINRHSQKNFSNFINSYRIEEAKILLKGKDKKNKIISIALDSGFNNLSTFNVAFKAATNQTPSEYRKKNNQF